MDPQERLDIAGQLSDMKQIDYKNTLAITSILELLIEKKILSKDDIAKKANELDKMAFSEIT